MFSLRLCHLFVFCLPLFPVLLKEPYITVRNKVSGLLFIGEEEGSAGLKDTLWCRVWNRFLCDRHVVQKCCVLSSCLICKRTLKPFTATFVSSVPSPLRANFWVFHIFCIHVLLSHHPTATWDCTLLVFLLMSSDRFIVCLWLWWVIHFILCYLLYSEFCTQ